MSIISVGGGKLGCLITNSSSNQSLLIGDFNLHTQAYIEAIRSFHTSYMQNLTNLQSCNSISKESVIAYFTRYIEDLIEVLNSLNEKYPNDLPFKEMANILRAVQGFGINCSVASEIIKLRNEMYKEKDDRESLDLSKNFDLNTFFQLIKRGDLLKAQTYFRKHPKYKRYTVPDTIESRLQPSERIFGLMNKNNDEFSKKFLMFKRQCYDYASLPDVKNDFGQICDILTGDVEFFMTLKPNWLEFIIFLCLFRDGIIKNPVEIKNEILQRFNRSQRLSDLELIFLEAFIDNMHGLAQKSSERYPAFFTAHLIDILSSLDKIDTNPQYEFDQLNYPEYYFFNYVKEIISNLSIPTEIVCDYIYFNLASLENCEQLLIYSNSIRFHVSKTDKLVSYFNSRKLYNLVFETYKLASLKCIENGNLYQAIEYSIKSSDQELMSLIKEKVLDIASDKEISDDLIRVQVRRMNLAYLNDSSAMYFLSSYIKYVDLVNSENLIEAGTALVRFFYNDRAPPLFYEKILTRSIPLFDRGLVLSSSNFFKVLKGYEQMCMMPSTSLASIQQLSFTLGQASSLSLLNSS